MKKSAEPKLVQTTMKTVVSRSFHVFFEMLFIFLNLREFNLCCFNKYELL